jgi:hypothetical protein
VLTTGDEDMGVNVPSGRRDDSDDTGVEDGIEI